MTVIADAPENPLPFARSRARRALAGRAIGWLRAAENLSNPEWIGQALQRAPELARLSGRPATAGDFG